MWWELVGSWNSGQRQRHGKSEIGGLLMRTSKSKPKPDPGPLLAMTLSTPLTSFFSSGATILNKNWNWHVLLAFLDWPIASGSPRIYPQCTAEQSCKSDKQPRLFASKTQPCHGTTFSYRVLTSTCHAKVIYSNWGLLLAVTWSRVFWVLSTLSVYT